MAETALDLLVIRPGYTLHVVATHEGVDREVLWFKYKKNGDFLFFPRVRAHRVGSARSGTAQLKPPSDDADIPWRPADPGRTHMTLHPSRAGDQRRARPAVNGLGSIDPVGLDFRTLRGIEPLMVQWLTDPESYPQSPRGIPRLYLGTAFAKGAPYLTFHAIPIDEANRTIGRSLPIVQDGCELVIAPSRLTPTRFLLQIRMAHDATRPYWPYHLVSMPALKASAPTD